MANNNVVSMSFDGKYFLSPHYKGFLAAEFNSPDVLRDKVIVYGKEMLRAYDNEFVSVFNEDESGHCPLLPEGRYNIKVDFNPHEGINFSFINLDTNKVEAETAFDPKRYLKDFSQLFAAWLLTQPKTQDPKVLEIPYSIEYLKRTFKELLKGNEKFWERFHRDFDTATAPMNMHFDRELNGKPPKTIMHLHHAEYLQLKPKLGL